MLDSKAFIERLVAEFWRKESVSPGPKDCPRKSHLYLLFFSPALKFLREEVHVHPSLSFFVGQLCHGETYDLSLSPINSLMGARKEKVTLIGRGKDGK